MKSFVLIAVGLLLICTPTDLFVQKLFAQRSNPARNEYRQRLIKQFDADGNGKLSDAERIELKSFLQNRWGGNNEATTGNSAAAKVDPKSTPLYKLADGPYRVETKDIGLAHQNGKQLQVRVTLPTANVDNEQQSARKKLPVIVFSHGLGGSAKAYQPLVSYWASHGYVCLQPTHGDSISLMTVEQKRNMGSLLSYVKDGAIGKHLVPRTKDVKLILDSLSTIEEAMPELKFKLDGNRIGMGGHSYGAFTTQMIGGLSLVNPITGRRSTHDDSRPIAMLAISPQGTGGQLDKKSWDKITRPTMVVTGTNDRGRNGQDHSWRLEAWESIRSKTKYLCFVKDAVHNFGGISGAKYPGAGAPNPDHVYYVKSATLAFWDSLLKNKVDATVYLNSNKCEEISSGAARISR